MHIGYSVQMLNSPTTQTKVSPYQEEPYYA